ncbi:MAG: riboflavin biosynthesis protein RibF [Verrucomicrobia bacterium]|nr:riboflavin biosynthesis protein RibF [Verrucomicrobiota bacterium]
MNFPASVSEFEALQGLVAPLYLAIGVFDGMHRGHKAVVGSAVLAAKEAEGVSGVLTFDPHPSRLFRGAEGTRLILPISEKIHLLEDAGVQLVIGKKFDAAFAAIEAADFASFLKQALPSLEGISVGSNFRFGRQRAGDAELLKQAGEALGLKVTVVKRLRHEGEAISSTRIRTALEHGLIESVNTLLGYHYGFSGAVVGGAQKGRALGFPTLNLPWAPECLPRFGVYRVRLRLRDGNEWADGVANYGVKPTVSSEAKPALEVHLLEGTELGTGAEVAVEWLEFLRGEEKFENEEVLCAQIAKDVAWAREQSGNG